MRFKNPNVLFSLDSASLKPAFREKLKEFFPLYMAVLKKHSDKIAEIRIEGHTDETAPPGSKLDKYFYNMELSQDRTRSVLRYLFSLDVAKSNEEWLIKHMTANGLSSSQPVSSDGSSEINRSASRRVEFNVRMKSFLKDLIVITQ